MFACLRVCGICPAEAEAALAYDWSVVRFWGDQVCRLVVCVCVCVCVFARARFLLFPAMAVYSGQD